MEAKEQTTGAKKKPASTASEQAIPGEFIVQPIIFESSGLLHPKSCEFLTQCAQYASPLRKIAWLRLYQHSVALITGWPLVCELKPNYYSTFKRKLSKKLTN
jgi:hypothetical protein